MNEDRKRLLMISYLEHINRQSMRRIVPAPLVIFLNYTHHIFCSTHSKFQDKSLLTNEILFQNHLKSIKLEQDRLMALWFKGKCLQDDTWCR